MWSITGATGHTWAANFHSENRDKRKRVECNDFKSSSQLPWKVSSAKCWPSHITANTRTKKTRRNMRQEEFFCQKKRPKRHLRWSCAGHEHFKKETICASHSRDLIFGNSFAVDLFYTSLKKIDLKITRKLAQNSTAIQIPLWLHATKALTGKLTIQRNGGSKNTVSRFG